MFGIPPIYGAFFGFSWFATARAHAVAAQAFIREMADQHDAFRNGFTADAEVNYVRDNVIPMRPRQVPHRRW